ANGATASGGRRRPVTPRSGPHRSCASCRRQGGVTFYRPLPTRLTVPRRPSPACRSTRPVDGERRVVEADLRPSDILPLCSAKPRCTPYFRRRLWWPPYLRAPRAFKLSSAVPKLPCAARHPCDRARRRGFGATRKAILGAPHTIGPHATDETARAMALAVPDGSQGRA